MTLGSGPQSSHIEKFSFIQKMKNFFVENNFIEVLTPPIVENPGMETHIHPFQVHSVREGTLQDQFLHTSPEFAMKKLLAEGMENIFQISYCFRDEPKSEIHRPQFLMLEWYRANESYQKIKKDLHGLVNTLSKNNIEYKEITVDQLFRDHLGFSILDYLDLESLYKKAIELNTNLPSINECQWDDVFFLLWLNQIEPKLEMENFLIVDEFPAPLAALSTISSKDPRVCQRFELFMNGVEIANCFDELVEVNEQKRRFQEQASLKNKLYNYTLPEPVEFYRSLEKGLPKSAGIALGVERLFKVINKTDHIFWD